MSLAKIYQSPTPSIISFVTAVVPVIIIICLTFNGNPWSAIAYSSVAIPVGIVSVIFGLIGLKTKLYKLAIISLIIDFIVVIFMVVR